MKQNTKILIIIPAYNEEKNITRVIEEVKRTNPCADILIVNDGSEDETSRLARAQSVHVLDIDFRLGIGGAMQAGFIFASQNNYDIAIQVDGDGQHDPSQIKALIRPILEMEADAVIGSRYIENKGYHSDLVHRLGMRFLSDLILMVSKQKFADPTSGFRAANRKVIDFYAKEYPLDYPEPEAIVLLLKRNYKVKEIPVTMRPRVSGESSIRGLHTVYYMVKVMLAIFIAALTHKFKEDKNNG